MGSFRVKKDNNIIKVISRSLKPFIINDREKNIFENKQISYLARPSFETDRRITYMIPSGKNLEEVILKGINLHRLYKIIAQIIEMSIVCDNNGFFLGNIIFDEKLIFVDDMSDSLFFIYQPLNDKKAGANLYRFIDELLVKIEKTSDECKGDIEKLHSFLSDTNNYKTHNIRTFIKNVYPSIYMEVKEEGINNPRLSYDKTGTGIDIISSSIEYEEEPQNENSSTTFLGEKSEIKLDNYELNYELDLVLYFVSKSNDINIRITKNNFIIGKSKDKADGIIDGNSAISRSHCTISIDKEKVYVEDNGSANGTYIDGTKLNQGQKVQVSGSTVIRLADEEFWIKGIPESENKTTTKLILTHSMTRSDEASELFFKTSLLLSETKKVLFVSAKQISLLPLFDDKIKSFFAEDILLIKSDDTNVFRNIRNLLNRKDGIDIVPFFSKPIASFGISEEYYLNLIKGAYRLQTYDYIVVDMDNNLNNNFYKLYELSDLLLEYIGSDKVSEYKLNYLKEQLINDSKVLVYGYDTSEKDIVGGILS